MVDCINTVLQDIYTHLIKSGQENGNKNNIPKKNKYHVLDFDLKPNKKDKIIY